MISVKYYICLYLRHVSLIDSFKKPKENDGLFLAIAFIIQCLIESEFLKKEPCYSIKQSRRLSSFREIFTLMSKTNYQVTADSSQENPNPNINDNQGLERDEQKSRRSSFATQLSGADH